MHFGRELQLERERLGVSLDRVAAETKVSARFLQALEVDDFSSLPGGVFQRGIVRSYCRSLGLDEGEWLARLRSASLTSQGEVDWTEFAENVKRGRVPSHKSMRPHWWVVLLLLAFLLGLGWMAWPYIVKSHA